MRLDKLRLVDFKNYDSATLTLEGGIHCFFGKNGSGKTNLLEAIHYLSFTRSPRTAPDAASVRHGQQQFVIHGSYRKEESTHEIACAYAVGDKKTLAENGKAYAKFSEHIGKYPLVLVAPNDIELIWDGPELRRRYIDTLLAQTHPEYLRQLIRYQAVLRQRNGLLRLGQERGTVDRDLLASYDEQLVSSAEFVHRTRTTFVQTLQPVLAEQYRYLIPTRPEAVGVVYESELSTLNFRDELNVRLERDIALGRTSIGVHRDDFIFRLDGQRLKERGSQGQQKSFLIALKLAEFKTLEDHNHFKPLLLLDDIFDKLDDDRIQRLMSLISTGTFGQIFLTDARPERSAEMLRSIGVSSQNFLVTDGSVQLTDSPR